MPIGSASDLPLGGARLWQSYVVTASPRSQRWGYRQTGEWRSMARGALFMLAVGIFVASFNLVVLTAICLVSAVPMAFVGGYLLRADEAATARPPRLPFLYVKGQDEGHDDPAP